MEDPILATGYGRPIRSWIRATGAATLALVSGFVSLADPAPPASGRIESVPFPAREPANGATLFERLDAERTGVDFEHRWKPTRRYLRQLDTGMIGGGVAIGDYDGDDLPDLFLTRSYGGGRLYRNLGDFRFEDATVRAGLAGDVAWSTGSSFADVNGDGRLDLYVCGYDDANRLYINVGDGRFEERAAAYGLDFKGASVMMAFADYDLDGDLDGYLLTNRLAATPEQQAEIQRFDRECSGDCTVPEHLRELRAVLPRPGIAGHQLIDAGQADHLYRNNGDGTFTDVSGQAGIAGNDFGLSATWWDYNDDGRPDLYVANDFHGADQLLRNNGDGTFTDVAPRALPHTPWFSMGSDFADIDNDGMLDFMASDMSSTTHYKSKLTMGEMEESDWFLEYPVPRQYMRNAVYLNTGTERFMEVAQLAGLESTDWTWAIKFADLDDDGLVDLFVSNGMTRYWFNSDLRREGDEALRQGISDLRVWLDSPRRDEPNMAFRNLGDLRFESVGASWGLDHTGVSFGAAFADLDRDGDLDLVVNNFEEPAGVYRNRSAEGHRVLIRLVGGAGNRDGVGAMVRVEDGEREQCRYLTLSRGFASSDEPRLQLGLGRSRTIDRLSVRWPGGGVQTFENLAADRYYTITEPDRPAAVRSTSDVGPTLFRPYAELDAVAHSEAPYDDFERQPLLPNRLSRLGPGVAAGDIDADGDDDLYIGGAAGQAGMLYVNEEGRLRRIEQEPFARDSASEDMAPLFFDADGDSDMDLYVVSGGVECEPEAESLRDRLYLNDGRGRFTAAPDGTLPDLRDSGSTVAAADFDRDGDLDLFVGGRVVPGEYPITPQSRLLRNTGGRFADATDEIAPGLRRTGLVTGAVWSDADGDGWIDLLVAHEWGPVGLWLNDRGKLSDRTADAGLGSRSGWFNGIAARDIDNDGDIDYVVTNAGLNTKYHPTRDHPALLYYGDFEGTGRKRLVEATEKDETLLPVRGRSCSTNAMPHLEERFPSFHDFAIASLEEIYTPEGLEGALTLEANTLESGVLLNDGAAHFVFSPLPRMAQASPGFGVLLEDFDGDGASDLYLAQNFFSPQPETGRWDGGLSLLLRGNGDGSFEPVRPDRSGLIVPGDAKGASAVDLNDDGWVGLVVAINDDAPVAFENRGNDNRTSRVRLLGVAGNPTAVGARVTLRFEDGSTRTAEVQSGSSYLSQSSATLLFGLGRESRSGEVEVRWPDGRTTRAPLALDEAIVVLKQPIE